MAASSVSSVASLTLSRPVDDLHLHCRDGDDVLEHVLEAMLTRAGAPALEAPVARALLMPNLQPPITTGALASAYRQRVLAALERLNERRRADGATTLHFTPLMSLYLTDATTPQDIIEAKSLTRTLEYSLRMHTHMCWMDLSRNLHSAVA